MKKLILPLLALLSLTFIQCTDEVPEPVETTQNSLDPRLGLGPQVGESIAFDNDGNKFRTVKIGKQVWMAENLKTTRLNDGTPIHHYSFGDDWHSFTEPAPAFQYADASDLNNLYPDPLPADFYGAQYNEAAIASGKLAPKGWRLPTEADFRELEAYLASVGHEGTQANALKSTYGWASTSGNGTNLFGFNALPAGYVSIGGTATGVPVIGSWATVDADPSIKVRRVVSLYDQGTMQFDDQSMWLGSTIRCIKE